MLEKMASIGMDVSNLKVAEFDEDGDRALLESINQWKYSLEDGTIGRIKNIFNTNIEPDLKNGNSE